MPHYVSTLEMDRESWLKTRQQGLGSSDAGAVLGFSPYKTPLDVYNEKISEEPVETPMNDAMEFGLKLEDVVAATYMERLGKRVLRDNKVRMHPEHPFMIANLDRVILPENGEGRGILEIKTASSFAVKQWETQIPLTYYAQVSHQMFVTGYRWGAFALLVDGRTFEVFPFTYDAEYVESQNEKLFSFWNDNVLARVPPPAVVKDLEGMPTKVDGVIQATTEIIDVHSRLLSVREQEALIKAQREALETQIKEYLGIYEVLSYDGSAIATWKTSKPSMSFDAKKLQKEMPDIYAKYAQPKAGSRRFTIKTGEDHDN